MDATEMEIKVTEPKHAPRLRKRTTILIQRSDGRVHEASVSDIDYEKQNVIVEWMENGETKGKSIEFSCVFDLNPALLSGSSHQLDRETKNGNENSSDAEFDDDVKNNSDDDDILMVNVPVSDDVVHEEPNENVAVSVPDTTLPGRQNGTMMQLPGAPSGLKRPTSAKYPRAANTVIAKRQLNSLSENGGEEKAAGGRGSDAKGGRDGHRATDVRVARGVTGNPASKVVAQQSARDKKNDVSPRPSLPGNPARMSNCARQIKKLEENRNERRLRLEEAKQEKQKQMNADPGNPNWQFLSMIREFRGTLDFNPLVMGDMARDKMINVCVRKRPLNKKEENKKEVDVMTVPSKDSMIMHECKTKVDMTKYLENQMFRFDYAFDEDCTNEVVYKFTAQPLIQTIFDGGMATCFAYGQTGSGKTHTMGGNFTGKNQDCSTGIYALATRDIFKFLQKPKHKKDNLTVRASFFEIYSGKVFDLLNKKKKLRVLEDRDAQVVVCDLQEREVKNVDDVLNLIQAGNSVRTSGQTAANQHSSRSHAVFQISLKKNAQLHGKFSFIDLAGNERGVDTMSTNRQTRMEGAEINKSLLALKECIRALARKGAHLPFRGSKLTQILRDSFIGQNSRTCMIAMISPGLSCSEHTLNTLRYAYRVKELDGSGSGKEGAEIAANTSGSGEEYGLLDTMSSANSDLASLQMEEAADDGAFEQLETINALREAEDDVLEGQKLVVDTFDEMGKRLKDLYALTNEVDYDVDEYADQMTQTLADYDEIMVPLIAQFRIKFGRFREELTKEEEFSKSLTTGTSKK